MSASSRRQKRKIPNLTLERIRVTGFKAIKSSGYIDLKPLTLFIGRNGSGKSSIVEALQWLQDAYFDGLSEATDERFRAYSYLRNQRSAHTSLHLEFAGFHDEPLYYDLTVVKTAAKIDRPIVRLEVVKKGYGKGQVDLLWTNKGERGPVYRSAQDATPERNADRLGINTLADAAPGLQAISQFLERMCVLRLSPTAMRFETRLENATGRMLDEEGSRLPALLSSFDNAQLQRVEERVSGVLESIKRVAVKRTDRMRGHVTATERMKWKGGSRLIGLPAWMLSEGTRRITALFALLEARPRPSLLIVEEIENGLDPWTLEFVFQALRDASTEGTQVIVTTHSPFLLDHVQPEEVVHVERAKGESTYKPIEEFEDVVRYGDVVAPGAMYISGYFSGDDE
jgi:predicted ATPase